MWQIYQIIYMKNHYFYVIFDLIFVSSSSKAPLFLFLILCSRGLTRIISFQNHFLHLSTVLSIIMSLSYSNHAQTSHGLISNVSLCRSFLLYFGYKLSQYGLMFDFHWHFHCNFIFGRCQNLEHCWVCDCHHIFIDFE